MAYISGKKTRTSNGRTNTDGYLWFPYDSNIYIGSSYIATSITVSFSRLCSFTSTFPAYDAEVRLVFDDDHNDTITVGYINSEGNLPASGSYSGTMSGTLSLSGLSEAARKRICSSTIKSIDLGRPDDAYGNEKDIRCSGSSVCQYTIYYEDIGGGGGGGGGGDYTASYITGVTNSVNIGSNVTVSFTGTYVSTLSHKITFTFGSASFVQDASGGSCTVTIPTDWGNQIPSSPKGKATAVLRTYNGSTQVGNASSVTFDVVVPSSYKPSVSISVGRGGTSSFNVFVQALSTAIITASASGSAGSLIASYQFSCGTTTETRSNNKATIAIPGPTTQTSTTGAYTLTVSCTVTDTRGNVGSASTTITAYAYAAPAVVSPRAVRCNSSGTASESGTYFNAIATFTKAPVGNTNSATVAVDYRDDANVNAWTRVDTLSLGTTTNSYSYSKILGGALNAAKSYSVRFTITDTANNTIQQIVSVSATGYTMFFKKGGLGVGFGMVTSLAQNVPAVEFSRDWALYHGSYQIPTIYVGQNAPSETENVIWLKPV